MIHASNTASQAYLQRSYLKQPLFINAIIFFTLAAGLIPGSFLGFQTAGFCWVIPCILSALVLVRRLPMLTFPFKLWLPWILLLGFHLILDDKSTIESTVDPLHRVLQILTPILVGMASSTYRPTREAISRFIALLRMASYFFIMGSIWLSFEEIRANTPTGLATQSITALLLAVVFVNRYLFFKEFSYLISSVMMMMLPLLAITRTVLAVMLIVFPTAFAPLSLIKRVVAITIMSLLGVCVFYLPQIQHKMFYSGQGALTDIFVKDDFATTGRIWLWGFLFAEAQKKHLVGHGVGEAESVTYRLTRLAYPHNDWLLTYYDLGLLGVAIFLLCNVMMIKHGYTASKRANEKEVKFLFCAGISTFLPFMLVMWTDNIMVYSSFFGNLQYCLLGLAYGALRYEASPTLDDISVE